MDGFLSARVQPFYRRMMGLNATTAAVEVLEAVGESGKAVSIDEVHYLLADDWRPRVMGAWYALAHHPDAVGDALATSLRTSRGALTAQPLAAVTVSLLGGDALLSLASYARAAAADPHLGAEGFVAAATNKLGGQVVGVTPPIVPTWTTSTRCWR